LLGIYFFAVLGYDWIIPVAFFFVSSVFFTRLNRLVNKKPAGTDRRNIWQVMANIIVATICSAIYLGLENDIYIYFYIALVSAVTADTWASELGPIFNRKCFSLSDGRIRDAGISGGISFAGTLAALAGAFSISAISYPLLAGEMNWNLVIFLALSGFGASFVDSLLGAFIEPRLNEMKYFRNTTATGTSLHQTERPPKETERPPNETDRLTPNDLVNLLASMTAPLIFLALRQI
jgi:uncharacterized protein (TIGR00297 family)